MVLVNPAEEEMKNGPPRPGVRCPVCQELVTQWEVLRCPKRGCPKYDGPDVEDTKPKTVVNKEELDHG